MDLALITYNGWCATKPNCAFTFHTTNVFCCFYSIMAQFELIKHKFLN